MRRRLIVLALCFSAVLPLSAAVTGYVMNADGQPIAGAKIEMFSLETVEAARTRLLSSTPERTPLFMAETDPKGKFTLESPKDPVVQLRVTAKGYAPEASRIERDEEVGAVALTPAEMKSGMIVNGGGKPIAGAKVIWSGAGEIIATTDEQGRYSVPDPAKWAGGVTVIHPDYVVEDEFAGRRSGPLKLDRTLTPGKALSGTVVGENGSSPVARATILIDGWPVAVSGDDGTFTVQHGPSRWDALVAKSGALIGARARGSSSTTVKLTKAASLTGQIRDVKTQAPIAGADVRLRASMRINPSETSGAFTDAKGNFTINGISPGAFQIFVTRPGYSIVPVSISLSASEKANKPLQATQLARVTGVVLNEQKKPVAAARLSSQNVTRGDPMMMMMAMGMMGRGPSGAVSAPDGSFVVRAEGDTDIQVSALKKGYPSVKSATMRLAPGERKSGVVLTIPSGVAVTGRVLDKNGKPVAGVAVATTEATEFSGNMLRRVVLGAQRDRNDDLIKTANDGTFSVRVKEGSYDFAFKHEGFATKTLRAVRVASTTKPLEVTIEPGVEISGHVTRKGAGVEGVRMMLMTNDGPISNTETAADGSFRITDLTPGQMVLNAVKEDEFIQHFQPITAPAADVNIEIPPGGRVTGRVVDKNSKQPVTSFQAGVSTPRGGGGMVIMMPPTTRSFTSDDGTFVLENVPAGQTQIVVNAAGYTQARISNITIEEGKTLSNVEVEMDRGTRVVGHVIGPDGSALAGVLVRLDMMGGRVMRPAQNQSASTDGNGDYSIEALEAGDKTFVFSRNGYLTTQKSATLSGNEMRIDAQLGTGTRVSGVVVTEAGAPVADAGVNAIAPGYSGPTPNTMTDANGSFTFEGLAPGHYNFTAAKRGLSQGELRDVDISTGAPIRITLKTGGVIYGRVTGLTDSELQQATVVATSPNGGSQAPVDSGGSFRIDGAPTGTVRVSARTQGGLAGGKSSPVQSVQLETGNQIEVNIAFNADTVIRGRVTRNGKPVDSAMVSFMPKEAQAQTTARTTTNSSGEYQVSGLDDATYNVAVVDIQRSVPYNSTYQVRGSGTFDVDMKVASLRGRVIDSDGNSVSEALIELREKTPEGARFAMRGVQTDSSGAFILDNVTAGSYTVSAEKDGYGTKAVDTVVNDSGGDVQITLTKNAGVTVRVVDARDGRSISARVHVTDASNATIYDSPFMGSTAEAVKLPLEAGTYRALITAQGYAAQTVTITSPSSPTIGMTPGGSIIVQSKGNGLRRARLLGMDGKEYIRGYAPAIFTVDPSPGVTVLNNIAPGVYTLQILGADGNQVTTSATVTVAEGQRATVDI